MVMQAGKGHKGCGSLGLFSLFAETLAQVSFTSWFLDAFNYAMLTGVQVG